LEDGSTAYTICAGDGTPDPLSVSLTGAEGENSSWVITDEDFNILGLPPGPPFDLEGAGEGVCLIWHASSNGTLEGVEVGGNALEIEGCLSLSNPIVVTRVAAPEELSGGAISTMDPTEICAGDGVEDLIDVMLEGASGTNSGWVITDVDGNILGLPAGPPFDLEGAGTGVCLIWHISFEDGLKGVAVGNNAADLQGCFALSNPITVTRTGVQGGSITLAGGGMDTSICVGDGNEDPFNVVLMDKEGKNSAWVITDANGNILGIPPGPPFNLEGAGTGVCLVWHLSFEDGLEGAIVGNNAADLQGCYSLSNPITVNRTGVNGGTITLVSGGVDTSICVGDGVADPFQVVLSEAEGANSAWVITNEAGEILGIPAGPPFDLEGAGEGVCLVWHLSFEDGLVGAEVGANAADLSGCFSLSNPIAVTRVSSGPECGTILGRKGFSEKMYEVFPNPVTSILNIKMQIESDKEAEISVTNAAGQQVISRDLARLYLGEVIRLDVSGIDKGYYFIKVESASGSEIKPFVVQ
jgi:hypothetical protein